MELLSVFPLECCKTSRILFGEAERGKQRFPVWTVKARYGNHEPSICRRIDRTPLAELVWSELPSRLLTRFETTRN